jgi:release factor glutamine methyltransferase
VFEGKDINNPRLSAELLLADTLSIPRINLYLDFEKPLNEKELNSFREKVRRRLNHEPIQYILGYTEFYGLKFKVDQHVLIPRPETELLVDKVIELVTSSGITNPKLLEIGTGSGCISIAVAKKVDCMIDALDINEGTLEIAKFNANINKVYEKINLFKNNFADLANLDDYFLVYSNPPYIPINEYKSLPEEIKNFEPRHALTDEGDGLKYYRNILNISLNSKNRVKILLEIGDGKKSLIENLFLNTKIRNYEFFKDLMGIERVVYYEVN